MPARKVPEVGSKFNSWTYLGEYKGRTWKCRCDCGAEQWPMSCHVISGASAGCRTCSDRKRDLGHSVHPLYSTWASMKNRVLCPTAEGYPAYGGRGLTIYPDWADSFPAFLEGVSEAGEKPSSRHTLDRIDNNLGYIPGNIRWATPKLQAANRRDNRWITVADETLIASDWCVRAGITLSCAHNRVKTLGWSWEKAVTTPSERPGPRFPNVPKTARTTQTAEIKSAKEVVKVAIKILQQTLLSDRDLR